MIIIFFFYEDTGILEALSLVTSSILWFNLTEFSPFLSSFETTVLDVFIADFVDRHWEKQRQRQEKRQLIKRPRDLNYFNWIVSKVSTFQW